ncbi:MAG: response regulator transcription factor [Dermatophilaceae bacterium]
MTVTVFLLDDHEIVRRGLRELLELSGDITVVGESGSALEAERRIPALQPDVAVLDARLPDGSGIDVCRAVRAVDPSLRALVLTSYDDDTALRAAVLAGASGYVLKDIKGTDLVTAIRRVAAGEQLISPEVLARVRSTLAESSVDPRLRSLTPQERRILEHIAQGMTNRQIASDMFLAEKTVKNYVTSILDKLGMASRTQAAVYAATHPLPRARGQGPPTRS